MLECASGHGESCGCEFGTISATGWSVPRDSAKCSEGARRLACKGSAEVDELVRYQGRFLTLVRAERRFDGALYRTRTLSSTGVQVFP